MNKTPFFSIIIPTLNEEKYLPLLLKDLSSQTNDSFEVIHVDGNSSDDTVKLAKEFSKKIDIISKVVKVQNVSFQRNAGAELARGEWIIFMDADNRIKPSFLDGIKYRLSQNRTVDLFTTWVYVDGDKTINKPVERTINLGLEIMKMIGRDWSFGALIGIKNTLAKEFKFDEKQKIVEDGLFVKSIVSKGHNFKIFKDPKYQYSLRRMETDGTISVARAGAKMTINYLQGKDFQEEDFGYQMKGGSYYDESKTDLGFSKFPGYIRSLPRKQYEQAKKLFNKLLEIGL